MCQAKRALVPVLTQRKRLETLKAYISTEQIQLTNALLRFSFVLFRYSAIEIFFLTIAPRGREIRQVTSYY